MVDHRVADLGSGDDETNAIVLCAFYFHVSLFAASIATQVISHLLRFN
jgi:hypothetical protein